MFTNRAFRSWLHVGVGAAAFAACFLLIMLLVEQVTVGAARATPAVWAVPGAAFLGYVATAWLLRSAPE
ncbi:hypothetical protein [Salisaeta longa]|uniref:hypothetical protein n=1 Tax=Salisaeta longa TaxID=503170 RepID=UPI0003B6AA03|nr:hypothetical protein [Salisaeta longa]